MSTNRILLVGPGRIWGGSRLNMLAALVELDHGYFFYCRCRCIYILYIVILTIKDTNVYNTDTMINNDNDDHTNDTCKHDNNEPRDNDDSYNNDDKNNTMIILTIAILIIK
jgi:hypothetical protein